MVNIHCQPMWSIAWQFDVIHPVGVNRLALLGKFG